MTSFVERDFDAGLLSFLAGWKVFSEFGDVSLLDREVVAVLVGNSGNNARDIAPSLINAYRKIGKERLAVVYLCEQSGGEEEEVFASTMPDSWIKVQDKEGELLKGLCEAVGQTITENLFLVSGDLQQVISEDAGFLIYKNEEHGFPWTEAAIQAADAAKSAELNALRSRVLDVPGLLFLQDVPLCRHPSLPFHSQGKDMLEEDLQALEEEVEEEWVLVPREQLLECNLVGLYFTAQWSGGEVGQELTGQLAEMYAHLLTEGNRLEIIFVSSDEDSEAFTDHFECMPWLAVPYAHRDKRRLLSELFGVTRVPFLVWVDVCSGGVLSVDGAEAVSLGSAFFPWSEELTAQGRECREAQALAARQEEARKQADVLAMQQQWKQSGQVVLKSFRHHAEVDARYTIRFSDFATLIGDVRLPVGPGRKYYYEVEVLNIEQFAQLGWCTEGFEGCSEYSDDGVGDDDVSWGFDGMRLTKWGCNGNNNSVRGVIDSDSDSDTENLMSPFGTPWEEGDVLGLAANMSSSGGTTLWLSVNGSYEEPNGLAFVGVAARWLSPALSAQGGRFRVNFGDKPFRHSPPQDNEDGGGYISVQEAAVGTAALR